MKSISKRVCSSFVFLLLFDFYAKLDTTLNVRPMHHIVSYQTRCRCHREAYEFGDTGSGRLKMREWKMRYGQNCKGGKCRSKPYGTPTRDYIEKALSYFFILVLILLVPVIALKIVSAFLKFCGLLVTTCVFVIFDNFQRKLAIQRKAYL